MSLLYLNSNRHGAFGIQKHYEETFTDDSSGTNAGNGGSPYPSSPMPHTVTSPTRFPGGRSLRYGDTLTIAHCSDRAPEFPSFQAAGATGYRLGASIFANPNTSGIGRYIDLLYWRTGIGGEALTLILDNGPHHGCLALRDPNVLAAPPSSSGWKQISSQAITSSAWNRIEFELLDPELGVGPPSARDIVWRAYLNGNEAVSVTAAASTQFMTDFIQHIGFRAFFLGGFITSDLSTHYPDGLYITNEYILDIRPGTVSEFLNDPDIFCLFPASAGFHQDSTIGGSAPAATRWESVGETLMDDGVTVNVLSATGDTDTFVTTAAPDPDQIAYCAQLAVRARKVGGGAGIKGVFRFGGVDFETAEEALTDDWTTILFPFDEDPIASAAFEVGLFGSGGMEIGYRAGTLGGGTIEVSQLVLEIAATDLPVGSTMHMKTLD